MSTTAARGKLRGSLGRIGIWSGELRAGDPGARSEAVAELDELGFGAIWIPGGLGGDLFDDIDLLLTAAKRAAIATGILNIWKHTPADVGRWWRGLPEDRKQRVMLGLGVSHSPIIGETYKKPLEAMRDFLDGLDAEKVPADRRCLAALAPKMLELARERTAGSHPYLVPPEHTAIARESLGPTALLAPEVGVILERDPAKAHEIARAALGLYMRLPNYVNNWRRLGFSEEDVTGPSDRLCDALFAWGEMDQIARRVNAHLEAGADHVCVQVVRGAVGADRSLPREAWRELAAALL